MLYDHHKSFLTHSCGFYSAPLWGFVVAFMLFNVKGWLVKSSLSRVIFWWNYIITREDCPYFFNKTHLHVQHCNHILVHFAFRYSYHHFSCNVYVMCLSLDFLSTYLIFFPQLLLQDPIFTSGLHLFLAP